MENTPLELSDYTSIVKRRIWSFVIPFVLVFSIASAVALMLPSVYKSTSTILIEGQEIPTDFVMETVTSYVEQRLQTINQRIMTTTNLLDIINRFDLYHDLRDRLTTNELVKKMREDVVMEPISAEVIDKRTGRPTEATIAFTLSYEGKASPRVIQRVADRVTSLFLEENLKDRVRQVKETSEFLEDEKNRVRQEMIEVENKLADFKEKHINSLPELLQVNIQGLSNTEREIERLGEQLRSLKEREGYLQTQLANIPEDVENSDKLRVEELEAHLVQLETKYSDHYPDVIKTKAQINAMKQKMQDRQASGNGVIDDGRSDNPAFVTLASQLASTKSEIASLGNHMKDLDKRKKMYQARIEDTPRVEQEYTAMLGDRDNIKTKFNDLTQKVMEAKVAQGLENEQKGERFTLIDPARLPEKPFKPNRLAIALIGLVLGIGAGVGFASLREFSDSAIHNAIDISKISSIPVLVSVPVIMTPKDKRIKIIKKVAWVAGTGLFIALGIFYFDSMVMDLDVFWAKVMRKIPVL